MVVEVPTAFHAPPEAFAEDYYCKTSVWSGLFTQEISAEERKRLQKRKHLADKLKEEVIKK